ncbi:MAG: VOC family protein [Kiloniellaceae bacterium]
MKKRSGEPWMSPPEYGRSLKGFGVNLLVRDIARSLAFLTEVFGTEVVYGDADFAVLRHAGHEWMLHADHAYVDEAGLEAPFLRRLGAAKPRGAGVELRLYGIDPDAAEARARARGDPVLSPSRDKPHGLRESYLVDPDGYVWVPGRTLAG